MLISWLPVSTVLYVSTVESSPSPVCSVKSHRWNTGTLALWSLWYDGTVAPWIRGSVQPYLWSGIWLHWIMMIYGVSANNHADTLTEKLSRYRTEVAGASWNPTITINLYLQIDWSMNSLTCYITFCGNFVNIWCRHTHTWEVNADNQSRDLVHLLSREREGGRQHRLSLILYDFDYDYVYGYSFMLYWLSKKNEKIVEMIDIASYLHSFWSNLWVWTK